MMFKRLMKPFSMALAAGVLAVPAMAQEAAPIPFEMLAEQLDRMVIYQCEAEDAEDYFVFEKDGDALRPLPDFSDEGDLVQFNGKQITYVSGSQIWIIDPPNFTSSDDGKVKTGKCQDIAREIVRELAWIIKEQ